MIINCTPHPIRVFREDQVILEIKPSGQLARIVEKELGKLSPEWGPPNLAEFGVPIHFVDYPRQQVTGLPPEKRSQWVVVSLVVALAILSRGDLLVP